MATKFRQLFQEFYNDIQRDTDGTDEDMLATCEMRVSSAQHHGLDTMDTELAYYAGVVATYVSVEMDKIKGPQKPQRIRELQERATCWLAPYLVASPHWMPRDTPEDRIQGTMDYSNVIHWVQDELQRVARLEKADRTLKGVSTGGVVAIAAGLLGSIVGLPGSEYILKAGVVAAAGAQGARVYIRHKEAVDAACKNVRDRVLGNQHAQNVLDRIQSIKGT